VHCLTKIFSLQQPKFDACLYPTPGKNTCPDDVVLLNSPTTQMPLFVKSPINIVAQSGNNVTFNISNPFGDNVNALYYQFSEDIDLLCKQKENLASCMQPVTVTAACMAGRDSSHQGTNRFAIVDMWFVDPEAINPDDRVTIPACCHPDPKHASVNTALFSYKVYCESRCPSTLSSRRRLRH
jgi:hypothetical protein